MFCLVLLEGWSIWQAAWTCCSTQKPQICPHWRCSIAWGHPEFSATFLRRTPLGCKQSNGFKMWVFSIAERERDYLEAILVCTEGLLIHWAYWSFQEDTAFYPFLQCRTGNGSYRCEWKKSIQSTQFQGGAQDWSHQFSIWPNVTHGPHHSWGVEESAACCVKP